MQRLSSVLLLAVTLLITITSCRQPMVTGRGPEKSEDRQLSGTFNRIKIHAPVDAEIRVVAGASPSVNLNGYANILPYITLKIEDGTLNIYTQNEVHVHTKKNIIATITLPAISGLEIAGSSDAKISGNITGNELKVGMAGSGTVIIDSLNVVLFDVDMAGASEITVQNGNTTTASYDIAGSGDIHAFNLVTTDTEIEIAGSGDAQINATGKLNVSIGGSGDVVYKGTPAVTKDIAGSGSVEPAK